MDPRAKKSLHHREIISTIAFSRTSGDCSEKARSIIYVITVINFGADALATAKHCKTGLISTTAACLSPNICWQVIMKDTKQYVYMYNSLKETQRDELITKVYVLLIYVWFCSIQCQKIHSQLFSSRQTNEFKCKWFALFTYICCELHTQSTYIFWLVLLIHCVFIVHMETVFFA